MDFKEKYQNALERAKKGLPIDEVFPELKESDDERIRKELLKEIEFIIPHDDETDSEGLILPSYHARIDKYRAYLEKQKEQKPADLSELMVHKEPYIAPVPIPIVTDEQKPVDKLTLKNPMTGEKVYEREIPDFMKGADPKDTEAIVHLTSKGWTVIAPGIQNPAEMSEEDEKMLNGIIERGTSEIPKGEYGLTPNQVAWLETRFKSLRPQPIQLKESYKEGFQTARHTVALAFMKYCDKIRPNGKMCLSNGECEEIENAFLVGDWEKIERYFHKYFWKPSKEQMGWLETAVKHCWIGI